MSSEVPRSERTEPVNAGFLPVNKQSGCSSTDLIRLLKPRLGFRKIGHTGTLDPFARGLLILCLGRATRLTRYLTQFDKEYIGKLKLGVTTDTYDREGELRRKVDCRRVSREQIEKVCEKYAGTIRQYPPPFSARKIKGTRMYVLARRGIFIRGEARKVVISLLDIEEIELPYVTVRVICSTGTYIRSLANDIGDDLGVGACLWELERVRIGDIDLLRAVETDTVPSSGELRKKIRLPEEILSRLPLLYLEEHESRRITNGLSIGPLPVGRLERSDNNGKYVRLQTVDRGLIAVGKLKDQSVTGETVTIHPETVIV